MSPRKVPKGLQTPEIYAFSKTLEKLTSRSCPLLILLLENMDHAEAGVCFCSQQQVSTERRLCNTLCGPRIHVLDRVDDRYGKLRHFFDWGV
jgi:hypothetical protein